MRRFTPAMANIRDKLAEFQGLYGPFTVGERVLQKIWLRGDFHLSPARLSDGRALEVLSSGDWNLLGGPDFLGARLRLAGVELCGDIEVHFQAADWAAHGHEGNPAFGNVVLHVVLFPTENSGRPARRFDGVVLPELVLLPLLHRDLEDYAADDALEAITARDEWRRFAELASRPAVELRRLFREMAMERWLQKVRHARIRVRKLGVDDAAHHTALEILGYRRNRASMLAVASRCPLQAWRDGLPPDEAFRCMPGFWQLHGVRPANHPRARLRQYATWVAACPDWPARLVPLSAEFPVSESSPQANDPRAALRLAALRGRFAKDLTGNTVSSTRLDTLACDGFLPLAAAAGGKDLFPHWFHWFMGDIPDAVRTALPRLGVTGGRDQPLCHGYGQGLLAWLLRHGTSASG
jgi:hypothetical protein